MARPRQEYLDNNDLGCLITAAIGLDRDWMNDAACVRYRAGQRADELNPWWAEWNATYHGDVRGEEIIKMALTICHDCSAQYACSRYAIEGKMAAGVWGMSMACLAWLQKRPDALDVIDMAEANALSVQDVVVELRASSY